jgi:hypothetical protein
VFQRTIGLVAEKPLTYLALLMYVSSSRHLQIAPSANHVFLIVCTSETVFRSFALSTDSRACPETLFCWSCLGFLSRRGRAIAFKGADWLFRWVLLANCEVVICDFVGLF